MMIHIDIRTICQKPHDVHVSNYKLRDIVQYVTYKNTKKMDTKK